MSISESNADTTQPGTSSDARQNRCGSGCGIGRPHKSSSRLDIAQHRAFGPVAGVQGIKFVGVFTCRASRAMSCDAENPQPNQPHAPILDRRFYLAL
ncbi:MAG: hypothetical protein WCA78_15345 [Rhizomicrobium sp.]